MAQLVERVLGKDEVGGSNPPSSSKKPLIFKGFFIVKNCFGTRFVCQTKKSCAKLDFFAIFQLLKNKEI